MTIYQHIRLHERTAEANELLCARAILHGNALGARWFAEQAATERHLAYELADTNNLAAAAAKEYVDGLLAERRLAR